MRNSTHDKEPDLMAQRERFHLDDRERLLSRVERAVLEGHDTSKKLLLVLPEVGSAVMANRYLRLIRIRWEELGAPLVADHARAVLIGKMAGIRETALGPVVADSCKNCTTKLRYLILADKTLEREARMRGLLADGGDGRDEARGAMSAEEFDRQMKKLDAELGYPGDDEEDTGTQVTERD